MGRTLISYGAAPLKAAALLPWLTSYRRVCPFSDVILLADPPAEYEELLEHGLTRIVPANLHTDPEDTWEDRGCVSVYKDRWAAIAALDLPPDELVMVTDGTDVYFQRNPWLDRWPYNEGGDTLCVAGEGILLKHDQWNTRYFKMFFPKEYKRLAKLNRPNACAGVVQGPWHLVKELALRTHDRLAGLPGIADQMAMNIVLQDLPHKFIPNDDAWCIHCACSITPWASDKARLYPAPLLTPQGKLITRPNEEWTTGGVPYCIVHHWTMVPKLVEVWGTA